MFHRVSLWMEMIIYLFSQTLLHFNDDGPILPTIWCKYKYISATQHNEKLNFASLKMMANSDKWQIQNLHITFTYAFNQRCPTLSLFATLGDRLLKCHDKDKDFFTFMLIGFIKMWNSILNAMFLCVAMT